MASSKRVAVVTGANKGIGYAIVRGLCKQMDGDVYLTARNESLGQEAIKKLNGEGFQPKFHQLDLNDTASIDKLKTFLQTNYGGLDILVNNAGMAFKVFVMYVFRANSKGTDERAVSSLFVAATDPFPVQADQTVATNFWGTLNVCKSLFPLLKPHARVVNVSSMASQFAGKKCSSELQKRFVDPNLTMAQVEQLMTEFVKAAKDDTYASKGWPQSAYGCSKIGVSLMSFVQHKELSGDARKDIVVNACCPGYVATDMSSYKGTKSVDEGADTPLYLALLPADVKEPNGKFVSERKVKSFP